MLVLVNVGLCLVKCTIQAHGLVFLEIPWRFLGFLTATTGSTMTPTNDLLIITALKLYKGSLRPLCLCPVLSPICCILTNAFVIHKSSIKQIALPYPEDACLCCCFSFVWLAAFFFSADIFKCHSHPTEPWQCDEEPASTITETEEANGNSAIINLLLSTVGLLSVAQKFIWVITGVQLFLCVTMADVRGEMFSIWDAAIRNTQSRPSQTPCVGPLLLLTYWSISIWALKLWTVDMRTSEPLNHTYNTCVTVYSSSK